MRRLLFALLAGALAVALPLAANAAYPADFPAGVPSDAVWLTKSDSTSVNSLTTEAENNNWYDGNSIQENETRTFFIPADLVARASNAEQIVVPTVYCAGRVRPVGLSGRATTFNDLRLLEGGRLLFQEIGQKAGNVTVLSENEGNPSQLACARNDTDWKYVAACAIRVFGTKDSHLSYQKSSSDNNKMFLQLQEGSDWNGFAGTLHVADGLGIANVKSVPNNFAGAVRFGRDGILRMTAASAPYSFGELSFVQGGAITNSGTASTLTVSGTFDTGTNCDWRCLTVSTFGTLVLGDGLNWHNDNTAEDIAALGALLNVTNRLVVGKNVAFEFSGVSFNEDNTPPKVLLMKLSPEAVAAGGFDLSEVAVSFAGGSPLAYLTTEEDQDVSGGLLVYATHDAVVYYNGPEEFSSEVNGRWLDPDYAKELWSDGVGPDGDKIYCTTQDVWMVGAHPVFPGKTLLTEGYLYLGTDAYVANLYMAGRALYFRGTYRFGGNITPIDGARTIRSFTSHDVYLDAVLHGDQDFTFNNYYPGGTGSTFYLSADNSGWTGGFKGTWTDRSTGNYPADETHHTRIAVGDAKSLGGNPVAFRFDAMTLNNFTEIRFTNTTVQTASNRGLYAVNGILRVDEGATAALTAPVTLAGTLRKAGAGTLALGGGIRYAANDDLTDATAPEADKNIVLVQEGAIKGSSLAQAAVTFSAGAGIAADGESGAMDLTGATVEADGTIYLKVDENTVSAPTEPATYPVAKVTSAQNETLGSKFAAAKVWKGWNAKLVTATDGSGNVVYSVLYGKKGFVVSIR